LGTILRDTVNDDAVLIELNFDAAPQPKCKRCGRDKGSHKAITLSCPIGRGSFPSFSTTTVYEPRKPRAKKPAAA
jgi:hypothetical protein